jgi:hypothetical protein
MHADLFLFRYFSGGKYFQRVGTYRGHGASAIKPKLQMQNSYDVAALTKNDMVNRPLKQAPGEKNTEPPAAQLVIPGLVGRYTRQADGSILVHDGVFTTKGGTVIRLKESTLVLHSTATISGGSKEFITQRPDYEDEDEYSSDDFTSSDEDGYDNDDDEDGDEEEETSWEAEFQQLMDNLVL